MELKSSRVDKGLTLSVEKLHKSYSTKNVDKVEKFNMTKNVEKLENSSSTKSVEKLEVSNTTKNVDIWEKSNSTENVEIAKKRSRRPPATANKFVKSKKPLARSRKVFKAKNVTKVSTSLFVNDVTTSAIDVTTSTKPKMFVAVTQNSSFSQLSKKRTFNSWSESQNHYCFPPLKADRFQKLNKNFLYL
jgi:hypothetical protein